MADFNDAVTPKLEAEPTATEKQGAKATPPKTEVAKPAKEIDIWEKADPKLKGAHFKTKRELETKVSDYERRIKEIEAKPKETPADAKLVEEYQKRINALETDLAQSAYERSPAFKKQFSDAWNGQFKQAVSEVSQLSVIVPPSEEGMEPTRRPATENDFKKILNLPPGEQDDVVDKMFGAAGRRVFAHVLELQRIQRSANAAIEEHSKNLEVKSKEEQIAKQRQEESYNSEFAKSVQQLQEKYPDFAPDEADPEASAALNKGYEFVDGVLKQGADLPLEERAAYSAVLRARAAAFVPTRLKLNRALAEVESLKTELSKFRKSDPGAGGEHPQSGETGDEVAGINEMVKAFKE